VPFSEERRRPVPESILNKALEFLGQSTPPVSETTPVPTEDPEAQVLRGTNNYEQLAPSEVEGVPLLQTNQELASEFPNLIFKDDQVERVVEWIRTQEDVSLDIETYGEGRRKEERSKKALSFVRGTIRLIQLSSGAGGETFTLDAALLARDATRQVLGELAGKALHLHNAIFDLPRLLRAYGVDLLEEDIRDTWILSKLLRAGQWEYVVGESGGVAAV
jgi:hypothetical protein